MVNKYEGKVFWKIEHSDLLQDSYLDLCSKRLSREYNLAMFRRQLAVWKERTNTVTCTEHFDGVPFAKPRWCRIIKRRFNFMFAFPCTITLYYIKNQQDATLAVFLVIVQPGEQIPFNIFIYSSLHVSSMSCSSSGETDIYTASGKCHSVTFTRSCVDTICFS